MKILCKDIEVPSRSDTYRIYPIGDVHLGSVNCDEEKLDSIVDIIDKDDNARWIGMGDMCEFINTKDPRFDPRSLAKWITMSDMYDISKKQIEILVDKMKRISKKCIGMVQGNHEASISRFTERDVHGDIVSKIKSAAGFSEDFPLNIGMYGWIKLIFSRVESKTRFDINLHHGFVGGRLAGAKSLTMQRWLWSHDADIVVFGHSHNTCIQMEQVESVDNRGHLSVKKKWGCYSGSFLRSTEHSSYAENAGYLPMPQGNIVITIRPGLDKRENMISIATL